MHADLLDLSIIIVNYNAKAYLKKCIKSIEGTARNFSYEIIVVDNNSLDGSVEMMREDFSHIKLLANNHNLGFSSANNQGARIARGRYLLLLNNDTLVLPGALQTMINIMDKNPGIGLLGCRLQNGDGTLQQSFGKPINTFYDFFRKFITNLYTNKQNPLIGRFLVWRHSTTKEVAWVKGACMFVRRQAFFDAEMMDENFFMFFEEVDLCVRIRQLGWKTVYTPDAEIVHYGGTSTSTNNLKALIEYRKSQLYFYKKHYRKTGEYWIKFYLYCKIFKNHLMYVVQKTFTGRNSQRSNDLYGVYQEILRFLQTSH